ncbi:hypothetical protein CVT24_012352 [Panaeolus cyanescens]|uniref:Transcription factor BYE1 n=1 Tax=Panaeolus cyanescens TaxID=181874 RepID=A0A409YYV4_9AGAR|nr:hypothetical protein CVT24_012352 [Panaeolus cyanescens]
MSTRSRAAKAGTASKRSSTTPSTTSAAKAKTKNAKTNLVKEESVDTDSDLKPKEVGRGKGRKSVGGTASAARASKKAVVTGEETKEKAKPGPKMKEIFCSCSAGDDGSPMIFCSACRIWYHFTCADLSEADAEEIMTWYGEDVLEEDTDDERTYMERRKAVLKKKRSGTPEPLVLAATQPVKQPEPEVHLTEEAHNESPMDEDKDNKENQHISESRRRSISAHVGVESDAESSGAETTTRGRVRLTRMKRKATASPSPVAPSKKATTSVPATPNAQLKRKASTTTAPTKLPPPKRKRKTTDDATENPTRKYCLGKLEALFIEIFLRYPHIRVPTGEEEQGEKGEETNESGWKMAPKNPEELTDEEKEAVTNDAKAFTTEFESCLYEAMSEPDKTGQPSAGTKYKTQFRMFEFNLKQPDRAPIHKRITSGNITPHNLAAMDSVDLADEETKQNIKQAEQEALEHSILPTLTAPRAKITHKGLQDIEDVNGNLSSMREIERQEQEEAERREKEKQARARAAADAQRQRTASISVPPESPVVPSHSPTTEHWGAPPPVPAYAMASHSPAEATLPEGSLDMPVDQVQSELNLDDLINIDEDHGGPLTIDTSRTEPTTATAVVASSPVTTTPTAISPFASKAEHTRTPSFDLNSIWGGPKPTSETVAEGEPLASDALTQEPASNQDAGSEEEMELESVEANDQDFDMFLDNPEPESQPQQEAQSSEEQPATGADVNVDDLPEVWSGKITMPLDSSVPPETPLHARQVAGRETIPPGSPLWKVLFPSEILRIEGRVPVDNSVKYLLQTRLNPAKELYAVVLAPSPSGEDDFKAYCDFLISRGRHGLLFPWGSRPKDSSPGREFYVVPLLPEQPLPEFMEMLDNLKLPRERSRTYLIGIWIINRGKLVVSPNPPPPIMQGVAAAPNQEPSQTTTPVQPVPSLPFTIPSILLPSSTPALAPPTTHSPAISSLPPSLTGAPSVPSMLPSIQPPPTNVPGLNTAALAAEVASMTPEQIQNVLRTLVGSGLSGLTPPMPPPVAAPAPIQPPHVNTPPMVPPVPQPWVGSVPPPPQPPYPMSFPPLQAHSSYRQTQQPAPATPPIMNNIATMSHHSPYDPHAAAPPVPPPQHQHRDYEYDYDYDRDYRQSSGGYSHQDRGDRGDHRGGWRGNRGEHGGYRGRGRGRGRGGSHQGSHQGGGHQDYRDDRRHSDQGWPRRRQDGW